MIEINNKRLCESCFAEIGGEICTECGSDPAEYTPDPTVLPMGSRLADKIIIGRVIGKGGFGVTYLGYDTRMDKIIAVKEYYPNGMVYRSPGTADIFINDSRSAEAFEKGAEKFFTEAKMVAQFNGNPNIVSVYDYFKANNTVYLIMEYLKGITLKNYLKKHGKLSDGQALYIMDKIAAALSITHSAGVLHRDISPDNIMICKDGKVKLIDFGAARQIMAESSSNLTVVMKPGYTPIEQYTKKGKQGAWTDIYSLGVSVYYALTGVITDDPYARMENDEELDENRHRINNDLWNILKKCTMINSSDRYGNAIDLRKALSQVSEPVKAEAIVISDSDLKISRDSSSVPKSSVTIGRIASSQCTSESRQEEEVIEIFDSIQAETAETAAAPLEKNTEPRRDKTGKTKKAAAIAGTAAAAGLICLAAFVVRDNAPEPAVSDEIVSEETSETDYKTTSPFTGTVSAAAPKTEGTESYAEKPIRIDNSDLQWSMAKSISKNTLDLFYGDILVTLELEETNTSRDLNDGSYYHSVHLIGTDGAEPYVLLPNTSADEYNTIGLCNRQNELVFVLPRSERKKITEHLRFEVLNTRITSVTLEDYSEPEFTETVELDSEYQGDWQDSSFIPKSDLESCNGDVLICLDMDLTESKDVSVSDIAYIKPVDENIKDIDVYAYNFVTSGDNYYRIYYSQPCEYKFYFILDKADIDSLTESGLCFRTCCAFVRRAHMTAFNGSGTETAPNSVKQSDAKPLYIDIEGDRNGERISGDWVNSRPITKEQLKDFKKDIKITLDIEVLKKDGWTGLTIRDIFGDPINIQAYNTGCDNLYTYHPFREQNKFSFVIPQNEFNNINSGIQINGCNVDISQATVEDHDPDSDIPDPCAKLIELDSEYPGSWEPGACIPKKELESFNGDVRITLNIVTVRDTLMEGTKNNYWVQISPEGSAVNQYGRVKIQADQIYPCHWADWMYVLYDHNVPDKFTFVISQSEINDLYDDGLFFRGDNFFVSSAVLEKA